jgi:hypothetical protein
MFPLQQKLNVFAHLYVKFLKFFEVFLTLQKKGSFANL